MQRSPRVPELHRAAHGPCKWSLTITVQGQTPAEACQSDRGSALQDNPSTSNAPIGSMLIPSLSPLCLTCLATPVLHRCEPSFRHWCDFRMPQRFHRLPVVHSLIEHSIGCDSLRRQWRSGRTQVRVDNEQTHPSRILTRPTQASQIHRSLCSNRYGLPWHRRCVGRCSGSSTAALTASAAVDKHRAQLPEPNFGRHGRSRSAML